MKYHFNGAALALCLALSPLAAFADDMPGMPGMDMSAHQHMHADGDHPMKSSFGHPAKASAAKRKITITMNDLSFTPSSVTVKSGETVQFVVHNASGVDHDFTIGDKAMQEQHRKQMAEMAGMGEMHQHHGGGNAVTVKAGQTAKLAWTFAGPGEVEYDCNIPGHYEGGMAGKITVTP